jgi:dihydrolipoamide dehydrogenase
MYDLGIIGAGPAGYVAAEKAGKNGLKTVMFDKRFLGGVCLNEGCIPTKTLLYSAKIFDNAKDGSKYGIFADKLTFDYSLMVERKNKVVKKLVAGISAKMKAHNIEVVMGEAYIKGKSAEGYVINCNNTEYICKNIIIATGSEALIPPIKGLDKVKYYTNREILEIKEVPSNLAIIGGGVIGIEFASLFSTFGTKVTIIEMLDEILPGIDRQFSAQLRQELIKKGVNFYLNSKVINVSEKEIVFEKDGKNESLTYEKLLVSVGRKANLTGFGLENTGVEVMKNGIKIDNNCRTNIPNIYAAGDITGFSLLAHTASREGEVAINHILGIKDTMRYNAIPAVVYTNPELSSVGLSEEEAKRQNIPYKAKTLPMAYSGRFVAENEGKNGICKILIGEKYGEIIGVHILGNPSSEIIYGAAMAIENQLRLKDLQEIVFPHPTVSEIFKETINAF